MSIETIQAENILGWRKKMLLRGGNLSDIDWLLDLGAGLSGVDINKLYLYPKSLVQIGISLNQLEKIWVSHLKDHVPLQYLLGKCPWRDFELEVNQDVLIPRQETELLVEFALQKFDHQSKGVWVDLGTGSGALAVSLSRSLPFWEGHAVDCSQSALFIAKRNIDRLSINCQISLHLGSWWEPLSPYFEIIDLVVANPPYIPLDVMNELDPLVRNNEPYIALCGGEDGLEACREVISGSFKALTSGGWLMLEHHYDQSEKVLELMNNEGLEEVAFEKDLNGIRRFAIGRRP